MTGFIAHHNPGHHVVKEAHVLFIFLRVAGIILGVFLGVATRAKVRASPTPVKTTATTERSVLAGERQNDFFHGRVVYELYWAGLFKMIQKLNNPSTL